MLLNLYIDIYLTSSIELFVIFSLQCHPCQFCGKEFRHKCNLYRHESFCDPSRKEENEQRFQCKLCDKTYLRKESLNEHYTVKHTGSKWVIIHVYYTVSHYTWNILAASESLYIYTTLWNILAASESLYIYTTLWNILAASESLYMYTTLWNILAASESLYIYTTLWNIQAASESLYMYTTLWNILAASESLLHVLYDTLCNHHEY